jgi:hypothetical protein
LKGVALSRQIARPAAQTGPIGAAGLLLQITRFQAENVRVLGEEWLPGPEGLLYIERHDVAGLRRRRVTPIWTAGDFI